MSWYYQRGNEQVGPVEFEDLKRMVEAGVITRETLVWQTGMKDWQSAGIVEGLFGGPPPPQGAGGGQYPATAPHVHNHLTKAILATIFCCLPLGIVAIVKAAQVNGKIEAGNYAGAVQASNEADNWANWSIGIGLTAELLYFFLIFVMGVGTW
jgi:hypothetical protein